MSMEYCHECDRYIDTDYNAEHFIEHEERKMDSLKDWIRMLADGDGANSATIKTMRRFITVSELEKRLGL